MCIVCVCEVWGGERGCVHCEVCGGGRGCVHYVYVRCVGGGIACIVCVYEVCGGEKGCVHCVWMCM